MTSNKEAIFRWTQGRYFHIMSNHDEGTAVIVLN
jgi:hypothetical protein